MLTDLQKQKLTRMFYVIDTDRNGYIEMTDAARLAHNISTARGWQPGSREYETLKQRYQLSVEPARAYTDPSGRLNLASFLAYHDRMLTTPGVFEVALRPLVEFIFSALDGDGDGTITVAEARQFYAAYGMNQATADAVFARLDLNHDGQLSHAEVTDIVTQYYFSSDPEAPGNWLFGPYTEGMVTAAAPTPTPA